MSEEKQITLSISELKKLFISFSNSVCETIDSYEGPDEDIVNKKWEEFLPQLQKEKEEKKELPRKISNKKINKDDVKEYNKNIESQPKDKFSKFVHEYFGETYNVDECKTQLIKHINDMIEIYDEHKNPLKSIIPDAILVVLNIPSFIGRTDGGYENMMYCINDEEEMIGELYNILKEWNEIKIIMGKLGDKEEKKDIDNESDEESESEDESNSDSEESDSEDEDSGDESE
jgi:hypothetical protein